MKKLALAFAMTLLAGLAHGQVVRIHPTDGITQAGSYGVNGSTTFTDPANWVDCTAYECDFRVFSVGGSGTATVTIECKSQLADADEPPYPCYGPLTIDNVNFQYGYFPTLAVAEQFRVTFNAVGSGTWKAFIVKRVKR